LAHFKGTFEGRDKTASLERTAASENRCPDQKANTEPEPEPEPEPVASLRVNLKKKLTPKTNFQ